MKFNRIVFIGDGMQEITCAYCGKNLVETKSHGNGQKRPQLIGHYYFNNQTICTDCWDNRNHMRPAIAASNLQTSFKPSKAGLPLKKSHKTEDKSLVDI